MKTIVVFLLFAIFSIRCLAQSGLGYQPFGIGIANGITTAFGNIVHIENESAYNINFNYYYSPFFSFTGEYQSGLLAGGSVTDKSGRAFVNNYSAIVLHADLQTGEYVNYHNSRVLNVTKNLFYGLGIGILNNNITQINTAVPSYLGGGTYQYYQQRTSLFVPLRGGYDLKIFNKYDEPKYRIDFDYTFNTVFGDGLDGYKYLSDLKFYIYISVGIKYCFGPLRLYKKPIDFTHF